MYFSSKWYYALYLISGQTVTFVPRRHLIARIYVLVHTVIALICSC